MAKQKPILSICIPTYNRSKFLNSCLLSILKQVDNNMNIEVIVSNNHSTDDTPQIAGEFIQYSQFKYFEQSENIGATKNFLKLVKEYAQGDFCWIIGDDDFLLQGALQCVVDIINENKTKVDYLYASVGGIDLKQYNNFEQPFDTKKYIDVQYINKLEYKFIDKFEELISPEYSIIFLGELMASIFRREFWLTCEINPEGENITTLENTYPHSVILANTFFGKKAIHIKTPLILALDGGREWWDKVGYILVVQVKNLLDLYKEKGLSNTILKKCYLNYLRMSFKYFVGFLFKPKSNYRERISFSKYFYFLFSHPVITLSFFMEVIRNKSKLFFK